MSTNKTQNYHLHSWEKDDKFLMDEVNDNFTTLDAKLHEEATALDGRLKAEAAARASALAVIADTDTLTAARTALESSIKDLDQRKPLVMAGHYVGDHEKSRTIDLGAPILGILVESEYGTRDSYNTYGGMAVQGVDICPYLTISGTAFTVTNYSNGTRDQLNGSARIYPYIAILDS